MKRKGSAFRPPPTGLQQKNSKLKLQNCPPFVFHKSMTGRWQQSGRYGQIEFRVAGRTRADATLTGTWGEEGGERLRVTKGGERDRATELASILHIIALSPRSRSRKRRLRCSQLVVRWVVCVCACVHMFACTRAYFLPSHFFWCRGGKRRGERCDVVENKS